MIEKAQEIVDVVAILGPLLAAAIFAGMWWLERKEKQVLIAKVDRLYGLLDAD